MRDADRAPPPPQGELDAETGNGEKKLSAHDRVLP